MCAKIGFCLVKIAKERNQDNKKSKFAYNINTYIFNKIDIVDQDRIAYLRKSFPKAMMVSATRALQLSNIKNIIIDRHEEWSTALKNPLHMQ